MKVFLKLALCFCFLATACSQTDTVEVTDTQKNTTPTPGGQKLDTKVAPTTPSFEDHKVKETFEGATPELSFTEKTKEFKTQFTNAAKEKPNFAGHYILTTWGCGTDCLMGGVIDAKSGKTYMIPFTICCLDENVPESTERLDFRKDSGLIIFNGLLNEKETEKPRHFYFIDKGTFYAVFPDDD